MSLRGTCFRPHFKSQNRLYNGIFQDSVISILSVLHLVPLQTWFTSLYCNCESVINDFQCVKRFETFFAKSSKNAIANWWYLRSYRFLSYLSFICRPANLRWGKWEGFKNGTIFFKYFVQSLVTYIKLAGVEIDWGFSLKSFSLWTEARFWMG